MLDWFLSKMSVLIFIVVMAGLLFLFSTMQTNVLSQSSKVQAANSIARVIDSVCNDCSINYFFEKNLTLSIRNKTVTVGGVSRAFTSNVVPVELESTGVKIYRKGGIVYASSL